MKLIVRVVPATANFTHTNPGRAIENERAGGAPAGAYLGMPVGGVARSTPATRNFTRANVAAVLGDRGRYRGAVRTTPDIAK